jgi:uncharacterized membrane protein
MISLRHASPSDRRLATIAALIALSALVVVMVTIRVASTGSPAYLNLPWNLFLAWVPFVLALVVYDQAGRGARGPRLLALGGLWLLFFPNAPYLLTDFKYLGWYSDEAPWWYDVTLLSAAACAGLALGFASLYLMHAVARRVWGAARAWLAVGVVLVLGSFGVFLGRVHRWNSWDVLTDPAPLFAQLARGILNPLDYPHAIAATAVFAAFLGATYLVFYAFARLSNMFGDESRSV